MEIKRLEDEYITISKPIEAESITLTKQESEELAEFLSPKWISVEDRLPEDSYEKVLVFNKKYSLCGINIASNNEIFWGINPPTHWMPLPIFPQKEEE